jgi:sugar phosphate isomerase/epimerase
MDASMYRKLWDRLVVKLLQFDEIVRTAGLRLGLEIVPGSLLGGTEGLMRLIRETGNGTIGYNFDTGHAWSSKECIATIPAKLAGRIYGTHLKDNFGTENLALPPGQGSIPWGSVIGGVLASGYEGSFDLEIVCKDPNEVKRSYAEGNRYMMEITKEALT